MNNTILQVFTSNIKVVRPIGNITFQRFIDAIGNMKPELASVYKQIKQAEIDGDLKKKSDLKMKLYYFTPCVILDPNGRRSYKDIQQFTGMMHLDFDHVENAEELKHFLFEKYDFIIAAWLSASGYGVKVLISIPKIEFTDYNDGIKEFKSYFWGLANQVMSQYKGFDSAPQNAVLPLFLSPDENILVSDNFTTWTGKGINPKERIKPTQIFKYDGKFDEKYKAWAFKNAEKAINRIFDNGHPQLRAASYSLGGYVGAGYLSEGEAIQFMHNLINSNVYLNKKPSVYKKTAITMVKDGQRTPIFFK